MHALEHCPSCGGEWTGGVTCEMHYHQMLAWEFEHAEAGAVHHLTVLCYHLQHPHLYSPEGLAEAVELLRMFVEEGAAPADVRARGAAALDSGRRDWVVRGSEGAGGAYVRPVQWALTICDVAPGGLPGYAARVEAWARSVLEALKA